MATNHTLAHWLGLTCFGGWNMIEYLPRISVKKFQTFRSILCLLFVLEYVLLFLSLPSISFTLHGRPRKTANIRTSPTAAHHGFRQVASSGSFPISWKGAFPALMKNLQRSALYSDAQKHHQQQQQQNWPLLELTFVCVWVMLSELSKFQAFNTFKTFSQEYSGQKHQLMGFS